MASPLLVLAGVIGAVYTWINFTYAHDADVTLAIVVKCAPVLLCAFVAQQQGARTLTAAFIFSLLGDAALVLAWHTKIFFLVGLGLFLVGHVLNILVINRKSSTGSPIPFQITAFLPVAAVASVVCFIILTGEKMKPAMAPAVLAYVLTLGIAVWRSLARYLTLPAGESSGEW